MSEVKPTIAALRAWLKTCPLIADEQEATGAAFRIAGLDEEATAFSIEDSPGDPVLTKYLSGRDMAKNYLFLSRREYGEADVLAIWNSWASGRPPTSGRRARINRGSRSQPSRRVRWTSSAMRCPALATSWQLLHPVWLQSSCPLQRRPPVRRRGLTLPWMPTPSCW